MSHQKTIYQIKTIYQSKIDYLNLKSDYQRQNPNKKEIKVITRDNETNQSTLYRQSHSFLNERDGILYGPFISPGVQKYHSGPFRPEWSLQADKKRNKFTLAKWR